MLDVRMSKRYNAHMKENTENTKRATVYFEESIHYALRIKAAELRSTLSDLVNEAVKISLAEDAEDLEAFVERAEEPALPFEDYLKELKKRGKI